MSDITERLKIIEDHNLLYQMTPKELDEYLCNEFYLRDPELYKKSIELSVFKQEVQRNLVKFSYEELQEYSRKIEDAGEVVLSPEEILAIRNQNLPIHQSQLDPSEEDNIKKKLLQAEILKKIQYSQKESLSEVIQAFEGKMSIRMTANEITKHYKTMKIKEFAIKFQNPEDFALELKKVYQKITSLRQTELAALRGKVQNKKTSNLLNEEKLELKKMFKRALEQGVGVDTLISLIQEKANSKGAKYNAFDIIEIQKSMNMRINCLSLEELQEVLKVNVKFYQLEDVFEQEIDEFAQKSQQNKIPQIQVDQAIDRIAEQLNLKLSDEEKNQIIMYMKNQETEAQKLQVTFDLKKGDQSSGNKQNPSSSSGEEQKSKGQANYNPQNPYLEESIEVEEEFPQEEIKENPLEIERQRRIIAEEEAGEIDKIRAKLYIDHGELKKEFTMMKQKYDETEDVKAQLTQDKETAEENMKIMTLELIQLRYNNKVYYDCLNNLRLQQGISSNEFDLPTTHNVPFNYNTKQNYVQVLHDNIINLNDKLQVTGIQKLIQEKELLKFQNEDVNQKYDKLRLEYKKLYRENKENIEQGKKYQSLQPKAKRMLLMLRDFYETDKIRPQDFETIDVEFDDPLIMINDQDEAWRKNMLKWSKDQLISEIKRQQRKIDALERDLSSGGNEMLEKQQELQKEIRQLKASLETVRVDLEGRYRENLDKLNIEHKQEIKLIQETLQANIEKMKAEASKGGDKTEELNAQVKMQNKEIEELKSKVTIRDNEMKILEEKIKKLDKKYKEAVEEKNAQMSKIFNSSAQKGNLRNGMSRLAQMKEKMEQSKMERSKMSGGLNASMMKSKLKSIRNVDEQDPNKPNDAKKGIIIEEEDVEGSSEGEDDKGLAEKSMIQVEKEIWEQLQKDIEYLDELEENMEAAKMINEDLQEKIKKMEEREKNLEDLQDQMKIDQIKIQQQVALASKNESIDAEEEKRLKQKIKDLATKLEVVNTKTIEQQFEIDTLKRKNYELDQITGAKQQQYDDLKEKLEKQLLKNSSLDEEKQNQERLARMKLNEKDRLYRELEDMLTSKIAEYQEPEKRDLDYYFERNKIEEDLVSQEDNASLQQSYQKVVLLNSKLQEEIAKKEVTTQQLIKETNDLKREIEELNNILNSKKEQYKEKFKSSNKNLYEDNFRLRDQYNQMNTKYEETKLENLLLNKDKEILQQALDQTSEELIKAQEASKDDAQVAKSLQKYKLIVEEWKNGQGDYIEMKLRNLEMKETVEQTIEMKNQLEKENQKLLHDYDTYYKQIEQKDKVIDSWQKKSEKAEQLAQHNQSTIDQLKETIVDLKDQKAALNTKIKELQRKLDNLNVAYDETQNKLNEQLKGIFPEFKEQLDFLDKEKDNLKVELVGAEQKIADLEKKLNKQKIEKKDIQNQLLLKNNQLSDVKGLKQKIFARDKEIIELVKDSNKKTETIKELNQQILELGQEHEILSKKLAVKDEEINEVLKTNIKVSNEKNKALMDYRVNYGVNFKNDSDEKLHLYYLLTEKDRRIENLKASQKLTAEQIQEHPEVKLIQDKNKALQEQIEKSEAEIRELVQKNENLANKIELLDTQLKEIEQKLEFKQGSLNKYEGKISELNQQLTYSEKVKQTIKDENLELKNQLMVNQKDYRKIVEEDVQRKVFVQNVQHQNQRLKERIEELKFEINQKDREIEFLQQENTDLQEEWVKELEGSLMTKQSGIEGQESRQVSAQPSTGVPLSDQKAERYLDQIKSQKEMIEQQSKEIDSLKNKVQLIQNSFDIIEMKYETVKKNVIATENEVKQKNEQIKKLEESFKKEKLHQKEIENSLRDKTLELNIKTEILKNRDSTIIQLKQQIREKEDWIQDQLLEKTQSQVFTQNQQIIEQLQTNLTKCTEEKVKLEEQIKLINQEQFKHDDQTTALQAKEEELKKSNQAIEKCQEQIKALQQEKSTLQKTNDRKNVEIRNLNMKLEELQKENLVMEDEINKFLKQRNNQVFQDQVFEAEMLDQIAELKSRLEKQ